MPYQFKRYMSSLRTGRGYPAGSVVPELLISNPSALAAMLARGDIELIVEPTSEPAPINEPLELPEEIKPAKKKAKK